MVHPVYDSDAASQLGKAGDVAEVTVISGGNRLNGYLLDRPDADDLIVCFAGIADDSASVVLNLRENEVYEAFAPGWDIAVVDWPGYGTSEGRPSADSLRCAAADIAGHFRAGSTGSRLVIAGYSMGTGPAVFAASQCSCDGLILIAPYASSDDLYNSVINIFHGPLKSLLSYHMDTDIYAASVPLIPLIIASQSDVRVPFDSSLRLSGCFPEGSCLETFDNITHGDLPSDPDVLDAIEQYLEELD